MKTQLSHPVYTALKLHQVIQEAHAHGCDDVDSIVSCYAPKSNREFDWLEDMDNLEVIKIGDAIAPRTVEEAVLEGLKVSWTL